MTNDEIKRLRELHENYLAAKAAFRAGGVNGPHASEFANAIFVHEAAFNEAAPALLDAAEENARLREALSRLEVAASCLLLATSPAYTSPTGTKDEDVQQDRQRLSTVLIAARAALEPKA